MKFLLVMAVLWAGNAFAASPLPRVALMSLHFTATEVRALIVDAQLQDEEGQSTQLQVKGVVSRPSATKTFRPMRFDNSKLLTAYVQNTYCKREYVPTGVSKFNAGRNLTASLGDYVPANLRIEITYYQLDYERVTRKKSLDCPNSMR